MIKAGTEPIPGFRLEERLGKGQFGEVWRARSPGNTFVALKFLQLSGTHGWKEFRAIQRVKQIRHANLMPIIAMWLLDEDGEIISDDVIETIESSIDDTGVGPADPSKATLIAEPISQSRRPAQMIIETPLGDQTLRQRLIECQASSLPGIPADELLRYLDEAAKGLAFLNSARHKIGDSQTAVQHCDVKPDNIMLMGGSAVVTDFGVAQTHSTAGSDATATSLGGTPAYMAPECFLSKTSHATDQYALAITYYELRTGELPFSERTYAAVYEAHKSGSLDFSAVSHREQEVLRKATSVDPDRRLGSCVELVHRLHEAVAPKTPPAPPRASRRSPALIFGAALVALAWATYAHISSDPNLARVLEAIGKNDFVDAASRVRDLDDADDVNAALVAIHEKLGNQAVAERLLDSPAIARNLELIAYLEGSPLLEDLDAAVFAGFRHRIGQEIDLRLDALRRECVKDSTKLNVSKLDEGVKELRALLHREGTSADNVAKEQLERRPELELISVRADARAGGADAATLLSRLSGVRVEELDDVDQPYFKALAFSLAQDDPSGLTKERIEELLTPLLPYATFKVQAAAPWEWQQVLAKMASIDRAFEYQWLGDDKFSTLIGEVTDLKASEAARYPVEFNFAIAKKSRINGDYQAAREQLNAARTLAASLPGTERASDRLARLDDEKFILDLIDPATDASVVHTRLATEKGEFEEWAKIANEIRESEAVPTQQAALAEYLRMECAMAGVDVAADLPNDLERAKLRQALASTPFIDYAEYVEGLMMRNSASAASDRDMQVQAWTIASEWILAAFRNPRPESLLTAAFRKRTACTTLVRAVTAWSDQNWPTDKDFGDPAFFGGKPEVAFTNLALARQLAVAPPKWDARLLAAAVGNWNEQPKAQAADLLRIAQELGDAHSKDPDVQSLSGTIAGAAAMAAVELGAADDEATRELTTSTVKHATNALSALYLITTSSGMRASTLSSEQLERLRVRLVTPIVPIAHRLWELHSSNILDAKTSASLAKFYRAAGLLHREQSIAEMLRDAAKPVNADDLAYEYLACSNAIENDTLALIEQGRALQNITNRPENWLESLNELADQANKLSQSQADNVVLRGQALALLAFARQERARLESRTKEEQTADREEALKVVSQAIDSLDEVQGAAPSNLADWLITRAAIYLDYAYYGRLDFSERRDQLLAACRDAEKAYAIAGPQNKQLALNAWGNALEDLALYVYDDPPANFELACRKFEEAIREANPLGLPLELPYARHLSAHLNLLRCQSRLVSYGVLADESEDRLRLRQAIDLVERDFPWLDDSNLDVVDDPRKAGQLAELSYWLSTVHAQFAQRTEGHESERHKAVSREALDRAVRWTAAAKQWDNWAQFQWALASALKGAGDKAGAAQVCREVLAASQRDSVRITYQQLFRAADLLPTCVPLSPDEWDGLLAHFSVDAPAAAPYRLQLRIARANALKEWTPEFVAEMESQVGALRSNGGLADAVIDLWCKWLTQQAIWHDTVAQTPNMSRPELLKLYMQSAAKNGNAIMGEERRLPPELQALLRDIEGDRGIWQAAGRLQRWQRIRIEQHLRTTMQARQSLFIASIALHVAGQGNPLLKQAAEGAKQLLHPDVVKGAQNSEEQAEWKAKYEKLSPYLR